MLAGRGVATHFLPLHRRIIKRIRFGTLVCTSCLSLSLGSKKILTKSLFVEDRTRSNPSGSIAGLKVERWTVEARHSGDSHASIDLSVLRSRSCGFLQNVGLSAFVGASHRSLARAATDGWHRGTAELPLLVELERAAYPQKSRLDLQNRKQRPVF